MLDPTLVFAFSAVGVNLIWLLPKADRIRVWIPRHSVLKALSTIIFTAFMISLADSFLDFLPRPVGTQIALWALLVYSAYTVMSVLYLKIVAARRRLPAS